MNESTSLEQDVSDLKDFLKDLLDFNIEQAHEGDKNACDYVHAIIEELRLLDEDAYNYYTIAPQYDMS